MTTIKGKLSWRFDYFMRMFMTNSTKRFESIEFQSMALWTWWLSAFRSRTVWISDEIFCTERGNQQTPWRIDHISCKGNVKLRDFSFTFVDWRNSQAFDVSILSEQEMPLSISRLFATFAQRSMIFAEVWFNRIFQNGHVEFGMRVNIFFPNFSSSIHIIVMDAVNKRSLCWQDGGLRRICEMSRVFSLSRFRKLHVGER